MATIIPEERGNRTLPAFLRQEVQPPAIAIAEFLDLIIEDVSRSGQDHLLPDLERMRTAGLRLNTFIKSLVDETATVRRQGEPIEEFYRRLRHDLRTPLNAIKGYSELLMEDLDGDGHAALRDDFGKLTQSANQLLGQIGSIVDFTHEEELTQRPDDEQAFSVVADVLRSFPSPSMSDALGEATQRSRILVVDDDPANRDVLERRLMREGHKVITAPNGAAALEVVAVQEFDLVLLDLIMPQMGGFDVLRRLKAAEHTSHLPVIMISALDELDSAARCIEAGAEDYLVKPFNPILLRARIGACLEKKRLRDRETQFIADLDRERRRSESLLLNILPQSIVDRMREGEVVIADHVSEASILFFDLVGFTALSQSLSPQRTIEVLSRIFSTFDRFVFEHGVEKIKTVGDSYMAAGGVPEPRPDHAARIATLALRMMEAVSTISDSVELRLQARIGIHAGPIVAGVIGSHKFVYDVWGDTVNTASRMESHSLAGRIQVSSTIQRALRDYFTFERRGPIHIRGKGEMETFFLVGRSGLIS